MRGTPGPEGPRVLDFVVCTRVLRPPERRTLFPGSGVRGAQSGPYRGRGLGKTQEQEGYADVSLK